DLGQLRRTPGTRLAAGLCLSDRQTPAGPIGDLIVNEGVGTFDHNSVTAAVHHKVYDNPQRLRQLESEAPHRGYPRPHTAATHPPLGRAGISPMDRRSPHHRTARQDALVGAPPSHARGCGSLVSAASAAATS